MRLVERPGGAGHEPAARAQHALRCCVWHGEAWDSRHDQDRTGFRHSDEAFYQLFPTGSPFIWVRKGDNAISIRILTWDKPRVFTNDQDKAKLAVLAKAAIIKL